MTNARKKYQLPIVAEIPHIQVDRQKLLEAYLKISDKFVDVRTANPALCDNHMELASNVYDNFDQINLTVINGPTLPFTENIKERIRRKEECLYNFPTEDYKGSYFQEIVDQFRAPAMRVRITRLAPQTDIPHHIDYDPTYAVRVIIPIQTNPKVVNEFKVKNQLHQYYLEEGKVYFLNTGFSHAVFNQSSDSRVAFMFSLDGQEDLSEL